MERKGKRSFSYYVRVLHRDIGFFVCGLTIIYSLSGIFLIFRNPNFLKHETLHEQKISPNLNPIEIEKAIRSRVKNIQILKTDGDTLYFKEGKYNKTTGFIKFTRMELPVWISKINNLHKASSENIVHVFTTTYGILLMFLAVSSFWMFKAKSKLFRRGIIISGLGIIAAIALLIIFI